MWADEVDTLFTGGNWNRGLVHVTFGVLGYRIQGRDASIS
jgi:hypothetical protein